MIKLIENKTIEILNDNMEELKNSFKYEGLDMEKSLNVLAYFEELQDNNSIEINHIYDNVFSIDNKEYMIFNDEEQAYKKAVLTCIDIIDDCGINEEIVDIAINHNFVDLNYFLDAMNEHEEYIAWNESIEYIARDEELEELKNEQITEEDIRENYYESSKYTSSESAFDEFLFQFGREYTMEIMLKENIIDIEELSKYCVDVDGIAHFLSSYDGEELEHDNYYLYRTN